MEHLALSTRRVVLAFVAIVAAVPAVLSAEPVISVWYRGTPAGVPREDDLALIRAHGFTGVTWPSSQVAGLPELSRIADVYGLMVVIQPDRIGGAARWTRRRASESPSSIGPCRSRLASGRARRAHHFVRSRPGGRNRSWPAGTSAS